MSDDTSHGDEAILTPEFFSAEIFAAKLPLVPEIIAPACPIVFPGGAVLPAMYATTGFLTELFI